MGSTDETERPTLRSLAGLAGVSVATVSRALKDDPLIARATRDRIAALAAETGYVPDRAARGLRTGRTHVVAVLISRHDEILGFGSSLISGMGRALRGTPYHVNVTPLFEDEDDLEAVRSILRTRAADGLIFTRTRPRDSRVRLLIDEGFPFVSHGRTDLSGHAWFDFDNEAFGRRAVERFAADGRRRIGMIVPPRTFTFHRHMIAGASAAAHDAGLEVDWCEGVDLDTPADVLHRYIRGRLTGHGPRCDGFVCGGEVSAIVANAAVIDAGLRPQIDVRIVAKQTTSLFGLLRPEVPAIFEDVTAAGEIMASLLLRAIDGAAPESLHYLETAVSSPSP